MCVCAFVACTRMCSYATSHVADLFLRSVRYKLVRIAVAGDLLAAVKDAHVRFRPRGSALKRRFSQLRSSDVASGGAVDPISHRMSARMREAATAQGRASSHEIVHESASLAAATRL